MSAEISLRSFQHYLYCPHRWGLNYIEGIWAENAFTAMGDLIHENAHKPDKKQFQRNAEVYSAIQVYCSLPNIELYGVLDCLEAVRDKSGVDFNGGKYKLCIVEYKPTHPKSEIQLYPDKMQLFAQKLCAENVFGGKCGTAFYYADTRKRAEIDFDFEYDVYMDKLLATAKEMCDFTENGTVPPIVKSTKCSGCSLSGICLPKKPPASNVRERIEEGIGQQ